MVLFKRSPTLMRQGDVLIRRIARRPKRSDLQEVPRDEQGRIVLALGETTGHAHAIATPGVVAWGIGGVVQALSVPHNAIVVHEEHTPIELSPGEYEVIRQREWVEQDQWASVRD